MLIVVDFKCHISKVVQACHPDENQISLFFPLDPSQCEGAVLLPGQ